ncbi:SDR family oxidoreductase [Streptomyces sp. DSM 42041]|uniref:SDR family oxidoreductase n=1 Tax=Streptomyces hazeniae TaxID=3075538 RepID=A0ABU2NL40_9ACTN|nr:SDR family oxidoreductase [Streptomyces sp. DSM 42041]MDT0377699.1 SDR family oxidoreductase [Streptomyces sp. DSM 42041]
MTPLPHDLPRNTLVVGASSSIGAAVVDAFAQRGDHVHGTGRTGVVPGLAPDRTLALDLRDPASLDAAAAACAERVARLDVVVFLAGILPGDSLDAYSDEQIADVLTVNVGAQAALLRRLLPLMGDGGQVVMTASVSGERGSFDPVYAASKAAVIGLVKSLATWLAPRIRVNAVSPALIEDSTMYRDMAPERRSVHRERTPTGRLVTAQEVAGVIAGLCDPAWAGLNGQIIGVNGGAHV